MRQCKITAGEAASIEWDAEYFKFCDFDGFSIDGKVVSSDFVSCSFSAVDWYWGIFALANFVECKFKKCTFRGTSFGDAKFVKCEFEDCHFLKDNVNGDCDFSGAVAYDCKIENTDGFKAALR